MRNDPRRVSQEEAAERMRHPHGYILVSQYQMRRLPVLARCPKHDCEHMAAPKALWSGGMLRCCAREANATRMRKAMTGEKNYFYGRSHSAASREKISAAKMVAANHMRGKPRPDWLTAALKEKITGVPRPEKTRAKIQAAIRGRHRVFSYCVKKAANGKTAGREGIFYVVRIGSHLKFGSATTTMTYRLTRLRQKYGPDVSMVLRCIVPDAGAYEAAMMERHREHWITGERFRDFLAQPAPPPR